MICCLNPDCPSPLNVEGTKYCLACGTELTSLLRNRYRVVNLLSDEGGFGRTYLAEDVDKLNDQCVVKQLAPRVQGTWALKKAVELFKEEAIRLQQLGENAQIPQLFAYFEQDNNLYLVQEFIDGQNLSQELNQRLTYQEHEIQELLLDLLPVLKFIHQQGVIHRDIKPQNIIRRKKDGRLVLIDFGASKQLSVTVQAQKGTTIGSQGYTPIEQLQGGEAYPTSDLYSLGATCFHLLSGFSPSQLWIQNGYGWVASWREHIKHPVSKKFAQVLDRLLKIDFHERYQSADEVLADLTPQPPPLSVFPTLISQTHLTQSSILKLLVRQAQKPGFVSALVLLLAIGAGIASLQFRLGKTDLSANPTINTNSRADNYLAKTLKDHTEEVNTIAISADATKLASGSSDNTIKLWNLDTNEVKHTLKGHSDFVWSVAFSPDGKILASGSRDKTIRLWNIQQGKQIATLGEASLPVTSLAISNDGKILASGQGNRIKLWNLQTKKAITTLEGHTNIVNSIVISADSKTLVSGSWDKTIKVWNLSTRKVSKTLTGHTKEVVSTAISPNGEMIASTGVDKTIRLWNLETGKAIAILEGHTGAIVSLDFNPNGKTLASGSYDGTIKLWNLRTNQLNTTLKQDPSKVTAIRFNPNGKSLFSGRANYDIEIWRIFEPSQNEIGQGVKLNLSN
ncbi:serine/threonine-protein kinase [Nostoc sp. UHCC 0870]|uniref:serine/threonine-protein kinase n=1 Tax=Nostoc sp. UHCC 0870 TaxID=2914041 RepID=UPI001EE0699F|nr:serine/threonine-protein kinase [Nostoc sp. UHCC 0870]UKO98211.1 serine/threonine protein kinase [Nostoc sp. UHCC 0870]